MSDADLVEQIKKCAVKWMESRDDTKKWVGNSAMTYLTQNEKSVEPSDLLAEMKNRIGKNPDLRAFWDEATATP